MLGTRLVRLLASLLPLQLGAALLVSALLLSGLWRGALLPTTLRESWLTLLMLLPPELLAAPLLALEAPIAGRTGLLATSLLWGLRLASSLEVLFTLLPTGLRRSSLLRLVPGDLALLLRRWLSLLPPRLSLLLSLPWLRRRLAARRWDLLSTGLAALALRAWRTALLGRLLPLLTGLSTAALPWLSPLAPELSRPT